MGRGKLHSIKQRIESTKSTQHITHAMEMVATAKTGKIVKLWKEFDHFWKSLDHIMELVQSQGLEDPHPFFSNDHIPLEKTAVVLITSDMGLCGSYNLDLLRAAEEKADQLGNQFAGYLVIGSKGLSYARYHQLPQLFSEEKLYDTPRFSVSELVSNQILNVYEREKADSFVALYSQFASSLIQRPVSVQLLPWMKTQKATIPQTEYEFEPPPKTLIQTLVPLYLSARVHSLLLESKVSELFSRQNAMRNATENARTLIDRFTLEFNKARQASITQEIIEIVNGAEALKEG